MARAKSSARKAPTVRAVAITRQIASGLAAIVHRDLKPSNVMLAEGPEDLAKIIDFGLAKVPEDLVSGPSTPVRRLTGVGAVFGTIAYLAPEAAKGMSGLDARADLYALEALDGLDTAADTDRDPLVLPAPQPPPRDRVRSRLPLVLALAALMLTAALGTYLWISSLSAAPHAARVNATGV